MELLKTIYQNVQISGDKGNLSHSIGCLLARVTRSKLIPVQLDSPCKLNSSHSVLGGRVAGDIAKIAISSLNQVEYELAKMKVFLIFVLNKKIINGCKEVVINTWWWVPWCPTLNWDNLGQVTAGYIILDHLVNHI